MTQVEIDEKAALEIVANTLAAELAALREKVASWYMEDVAPRGDKIMMREYKEHFGII
jgi:hypothetical protein